jgi:hypothetical protein
MTKEELIRMAREAGFWKDQPMYYDTEMLERFAALVEQRVRSEIALEELAKISEELGGY